MLEHKSWTRYIKDVDRIKHKNMTSYDECFSIETVDWACRSDRFFATHSTKFTVTVVVASISKIFWAGGTTKWSFTSVDSLVSLKKIEVSLVILTKKNLN